MAYGCRNGPSATTDPLGAETCGDDLDFPVTDDGNLAVTAGAIAVLFGCVFEFAEGETCGVDDVVSGYAEVVGYLVDAAEAHETYQPRPTATLRAVKVPA